MKLTITFAGLLIAVAAGQAMAEEGLIHRTRATLVDKALNNGFDTCAEAFLARIFPGQNIKFRTKLNLDDQTRADVRGDITFKVQAKLKGDYFKLAEASCTVNSRDAQLVRMDVSLAPSAEKLAGLTPKNVQFAVVSR